MAEKVTRDLESKGRYLVWKTEDNSVNPSCNPFNPETSPTLLVLSPFLESLVTFLPTNHFFVLPLRSSFSNFKPYKICPTLLSSKEGWTNNHVFFTSACSSETVFYQLLRSPGIDSASLCCLAAGRRPYVNISGAQELIPRNRFRHSV